MGDKGSFSSDASVFEVMDTQFSGDAFTHFGTVSSGQLKVGDKILASVNPVRRKSITLNHTGTHMLHKALMMILGDHVQQRGSLVGRETKHRCSPEGIFNKSCGRRGSLGWDDCPLGDFQNL